MRRILILFTLLLLVSCKTRYIEVEKYVDRLQTETEYLHDSIYVHDSTFVHHKGDTVYMDKWHTKFIERIHTDSFIKTDSIRVPVPYYVEKKLNWWQRMKMDFGGIAFGALLAVVFIITTYGLIKVRKK